MTMKDLKNILIVAGLVFGLQAAWGQLPPVREVSPEALKSFADKNVGRRAILTGDRDKDGFLSKAEADSLQVLNLASYRIDPFDVLTYEDLVRFPNLKRVDLGESNLKEVDLSKNGKLEEVNIHSDSLQVLILSVGCTPKITYPVHSGEIIVRRVVNPDDPNAIWYY